MTRVRVRAAVVAASVAAAIFQWNPAPASAQTPQAATVPRAAQAAAPQAQRPQRRQPDIPSRTETGEGLIIRQRSEQTGRARFASTDGRGVLLPMPDGADPEARGRAFVRDYGPAFGISDNAQLRLRRADAADMVGIEHVRFEQLHLGVPVFGGEMFVHMRGARVVGANGNIVSNPPSNVTPSVTAAAALDAARDVVAAMPAQAGAPEFSEPRLEIIDPSLLGYPDTVPHLAWFVEATGPALREAIWVDARTGAVLLHFNQVAEAAGTPNRQVFDAYSVLDEGLLVRSEGQPDTGDPDIDKAYLYAGATYDFFYNQYGRDSYDGMGAAMKSTVRASFNGSKQCGWDGNAWWNGSRVSYCAGEAQADDVVAHEWTHAVTQYSADLTYAWQSGALNESFSDIFGETIDQTNGYGLDTHNVRWLIDEDLPTGGAIRSLSSPGLFGQPEKVTDGNAACVADGTDNGGVHTNSGIPNHAYALAVDGGTYNGKTIAGIGLEKAARLWYYALMTRLGTTSTFWDLYTAVNDSCSALTGAFGITASDCAQVQAALDAVEMNLPFCGRRALFASPWTYEGFGMDVRDSVTTYDDGHQVNTIHEATGWNPNSGVDPSPLVGSCQTAPCRFPRFAMERRGPGQWVPQTDTYTRFSDDYSYSPNYHYRITSTFTLDAAGLLTGHAWFDDWEEFYAGGPHRASSNRQFDWTINLETREAAVWWYNDTTYLPFEGATYRVNDVRHYSYTGRVAFNYSIYPPPGTSTAGSLWTLNPARFDDASFSTPLALNNVRRGRAAARLAADGRSAIVLMFQADLPDPVTFSVSALPGTTNFGLSGYLPTYLTNPQPNRSLQLQVNPVGTCQPATTPGERPCTFLALLWAPDSMPPQMPTTQGIYKGVPVTISATQGTTDSLNTVVTVVPPPVVTIDGAWDGVQGGWGQFGKWLVGKYPHDVIVHAESDASAPYADAVNQARLQGAIAEALYRANASGLAARRVDVLAHGTGGIILRCFLESSGGPGCGQTASWPVYFAAHPVHQAVFVGTPHTGSPLIADFFSHRNDTTGASDPLVLAACGPGCTLETALDKVAGMPLSQLARAFTLSFGAIDTGQPPDVEYRSIVGVAPTTGGLPSSSTQWLLDAIAKAYLGKTVETELGGQTHDTIVTVNSQQGSTDPNLVTSVQVPGVVHRSADGTQAETQSSAVWEQATRFLSESYLLLPAPAGPTSALTTKTLATPATDPLLDLSGYTQVAASHLGVTPASGTLLAYDLATLTATSPDKTLVQFLLFQQVDDPSDVPFRYVTSAPFTINFVPRRLGAFQFTAIGIFDDQTYAVVNASFAVTMPNPTPMSLQLVGNSIVPFAVGETRVLRAEAAIALGATIDVTALASYTPRNGSVFSVAPGGAVTGLAAGVDWLDVSYGGKSASALIVVGDCAFTIGSPGDSLPAAGGTVVVWLNANPGCVWRATSDVPWATATPASGSGNALLTVTFGANGSTSTRYASVSVGDQHARIAQFGTACTFAPVSLPSMGPDGGMNSFSVGQYSGCDLTVGTNATWVNAAMTSDSVVYTVEPNPSYGSRSTTIVVGGVPLTLKQDGVSGPFGPNLLQNGDFSNGLSNWQTYATPDLSYIAAAANWGPQWWELQFSRVPPPPGTSNQATVFQNTGAPVASGATLRARFSLRNTAPSRRRISVLLLESDFSDLAVCTFWLPPSAAPQTYTMRMHTTKAWNNASIYFYAATAATDGGFYGIGDVWLQEELAAGTLDRTECTDATAPGPLGGTSGPNLLTNGDFDTQQLAPWGLYGQIVSQISNGVFEFYRPAGTPAGVVLQNTGEAMAANQILTARFQLGNSSTVRKRVTVLLHDNNFSDLSACTFWLPPGQPLSTYTMQAFTTQAWSNATISFYPATVGTQQWFQLDDVWLQRSPGAMTTGAECIEPAPVAPASPAPQNDSTTSASSTTAQSGAAGTSGVSGGAAATGPTSTLDQLSGTSPADGWREVAPGNWVATALTTGAMTLTWNDTFDLRTSSRAVLTFGSSLQSQASTAEVLARADGGPWLSLRTLSASADWQAVDVGLDAFAGSVVEVRFVLHGVEPAEGADPDWWAVDEVSVVAH